jgi:hypothetical protein
MAAKRLTRAKPSYFGDFYGDFNSPNQGSLDNQKAHKTLAIFVARDIVATTISVKGVTAAVTTTTITTP